MSKKKEKLIARQREIIGRLGDLNAAAAKRELTADEASETAALEREYDNNAREVQTMNLADEAARHAVPEKAGDVLREVLQQARRGEVREVTMASGDNYHGVAASGAVNLTIKDLIPALDEGLGLPPGLQIATGVTGNVVYPFGINAVNAEVVGEVATVTDTVVDFDMVQVAPVRVSLSMEVSNKAIDNAAFDLMGYVSKQYSLALKRFVAMHLYSPYNQTTWTKGPFSGKTGAAAKGTIKLYEDTYKDILQAVAAFSAQGFDTEGVCIVMDATTEANLKATPKAEGQGGFIIEGGKCAGYDYVVSHYINNYEKGGNGSDKANMINHAGAYLGIGVFPYVAVQQHGEVRLTIDSTSKAVAAKNVTGVVLNTEFSITDLSAKLKDTDGNDAPAFALYSIAETAPQS